MKRYFLLVFATIFLLFLFNGQLLITDSVESNYALTAKEMFISNDWLSPQIYGHYWFDKPIFFYWLVALSYKIFGVTEFAARFPSSLLGCLSILFIFWCATKLYSKEVGFYSALILLSSFSFFLINKSVITDAALFLFFSATLIFFLLGYNINKNYYLLVYFFSALATLTKGPIGFLLPGLIIFFFLLLEKNFREILRMHVFSGLIIFSILTLPWYLFMYQSHGMNFINTFFGTHNFLRATVSEHPQNNVPYYYTLILILGFSPWFSYLVLFFKNFFKNLRTSCCSQTSELFLILWATIPFIFFQLIATKYITYTFPILFPLSILLAKFFASNPKVVFNKFSLYANHIFIALIVFVHYWAKTHNLLQINMFYLLIIYFLLHIFCSQYFSKRKNALQLFTYTAISACVFYILIVYTTLIPLTELRSAKVVANTLKSDHRIASYGDYPTSATFYGNFLIYKLDRKNNIINDKPVPYSWKSKNVMPFLAIEDLKKDDLILVSQKNYNDFTQKCLYEKKEILHYTNWSVFQILKT